MAETIPTRAVKAVIANENDEILFLQRNPETRDAANWDLPGGLVEDETDEDALQREAREELGVEIEVGRLVGHWSFYRPLDGKVVEVSNFACRIVSGEMALSDEHIAGNWVARSSASELQVKDQSLFDALG